MLLRRKIIAAFTAVMLILAVRADFKSILAAECGAVPDQIVCTPHGDLKTQVGLAWVTNQSGTAAKAQVKKRTLTFRGTMQQPIRGRREISTVGAGIRLQLRD